MIHHPEHSEGPPQHVTGVVTWVLRFAQEEVLLHSHFSHFSHCPTDPLPGDIDPSESRGYIFGLCQLSIS